MSSSLKKILFMGTPSFCIPSLKALEEEKSFELPFVITQPDAPSGRKMKLTPTPVKAFCLEKGIEVYTPNRVSSEDWVQKIKDQNFDAAVVLAYGQLLRQELLDVLPNAFINIHASLLPRWRGAAPIQRAVMEGDFETGLSFQAMRLKLDSGPVLYEVKTKIEKNEDSLELAGRLSAASGEAVVPMLKSFFREELKMRAQEESLVTYARKIDKAESELDLAQKALDLHNQVRGLQWGPGAYVWFRGKRLKISKTQVKESVDFKPGKLAEIDAEGVMWLGTGQGLLGVSRVQVQGKPKSSIKDFANGYNLTTGETFLKS